MLTAFSERDIIERVLIVDDELLFCVHLEEMLDQRGIRHASLPSPVGLAETIETFNPDVIFLDIRLEQSDAFEAMEHTLAGRYQGIVCLVSGSPLDFILDAAAVGANLGLCLGSSLRKPVLDGDLDEALRTASLMLSSRSIADERRHQANATDGDPRLTLRQGLDDGMLEVWYQPTYDLATEEVAGAEALIRGRKNGQVILPEELFRQASRQDFLDLTLFVLATVIDHFRSLAGDGVFLRPSINVPSSFLTEADPASLIRDVAKEIWWPGMILEVTEDEALSCMATLNRVALQLKLYAVELSIDDFGAGYSSLARLRDLPFTELKLDRSFVHGCSSDSVKLAICKSVLALGAELGCLTLAEGVEDEADLLVLRDFGCDKVQGFRFARPMPFADLKRLLSPARCSDDRCRTLQLT